MPLGLQLALLHQHLGGHAHQLGVGPHGIRRTGDAEHANQTQAGQTDFYQLDNYQLGESLSRISWAYVARGQGLLAKRFAEPVGQQQVLDYYQMPAVTHEERLAQLRYGLDTLQQAQVAYRLRLPDGEGEFGQGTAFYHDNLLRLAQTP